MTTFRTDGLDSPISPNGPHPLYYVTVHGTGERRGPYSCLREAELHTDTDRDEIEDHHGRPVVRTDC